MTDPLSAVLSPLQSHLGALALTLSYVGSLYLTKPERNRPPPTANEPALDDVISQDFSGIRPTMEGPLNRDHPIVIKSRIRAVTTATVVGCVGVGLTVYTALDVDWRSALSASANLLGLTLPTSSILPYILAPTLFIGPLYTTYLDRCLPFQLYGKRSLGLGSAEHSDGMLDCLRVLWVRRPKGGNEAERSKAWALEQRRWIELRNIIAGPVSEELVFRACVIALYKLGGFSDTFVVFVSPLWFGIAHLHHAYDTFVKGGRTAQAAVQATVSSLFQFTYTTLFGWFASHLFVKTGSIWPPVAAHVFCNVMGFPNPSYTLQQNPGHKGRVLLAYVVGLVGFVVGLRRS